MAVDVTKLIAAINPDLYCERSFDERGKSLIDKVKEIAKKEGYLKAAEEAKLRESVYLDIGEVRFTKGVFSFAGLKSPIERHEIVYDAYSQSLEPIYFWILDSANDLYGGTEKLIDNFLSSPGSGHFAELNSRATVLHDKAMSIFATINNVIRSVLNLIYDLKEFQIRLGQYKNLHSNDSKLRNAAKLALKQIWLDNVDIKRGNTSIKGMAQQFDFVILIDAFMAADSLEKVRELDLNERVKRILEQRISEFELWLKESERELQKRFEIEKIYLKSQINSLKIYARWLKPYLKNARLLEQQAKPTADIVSTFNTTIFELVLLAKGKYDPKKDVATGELPKLFNKIKTRTYYPITIIELGFRSITERVDQRGGYGFRGRANIKFTSFALNDEELKVFKEEIDKDDFNDVYSFIEGATEESLQKIQQDIEEFLGEKETAKKEEKKKEEDINPFSALFSIFKKEKTEEKKDLSKGIKKDNEYEKAIRNQAILSARENCRKLYESFKKSFDMFSF